ncbi:UDP-3-O-acylglucosamine N-acyltransferase, partial [Frankliniella fusca]
MHENVIKDADHDQSYPKSPMSAGNDSGPSDQSDLAEVLFQSLPLNYSLSPSLQNSPKYLNHNDISFNEDYLSDQKYTLHDKTAIVSNYYPPKPDTLHYKELPQDRNESLEWEDLEEEEVTLDDHEEGMGYNGPNSPPLFRGAPISLHESLVSILSLALKFSLSGQLLQSLLQLINIYL